MSDNGEYTFDKERTFRVDHHSEIDGEHYKGTFVAERLSLGGQAQVGTIKTQLNGGFHHNEETGGGVDAATDFINSMIAQCEVGLKSSPKWWNARETHDLDLLRKVFEEVTAFTTFRGWKESAASPSAESTGERKEGESPDKSTEVVDL